MVGRPLVLVCLSVASLALTVRAQTPRRVTFSRDIAPILFRECATCHRPGGSAASDLLTYDAARGRARQLAAVTAARVMPPWKPEAGYGSFEGVRRLNDEQIALFQRWIDDGLEEGERADLPPRPAWPSDWERGEPDLVLTMPAYTLRADGPDMFRNFVVAVPGGARRYVRAWEFRPGNARAVHHATMQVDSTGSSRRFDDQDDRAGYEGLIAPSARAPEGFFLDWAPGHRANQAADGTAWPLPADSDLVMMLHLRPTGKEERVQASVGLYFSETPPTRLPVMLRMTRQDLDIAAGVTAYRTADAYTLPVDVVMYTVQPHAHYLAKEIRGTAQLPGGTVQPLLLIKHWDFDWQDVYHYEPPLAFPAGTRLSMEIIYDNSAANVRNPHSPPRRVTYGQQTSDEMGELWFQVVPRNSADRDALGRSLVAKILPEEIKGLRMMLAKEPTNVALHDDLAMLYADTGDLVAATEAFKAALQLVPSSAAANYNVGAALLATGDRRSARPYLEAALVVDPRHAKAHHDLAVILQADGDLTSALVHHGEALRLRPTDADMQLSAGVGYAMAGRPFDALAHLAEALRLRPGWPNAQAALASVMAARPGATPDELRAAVTLAELAVRATGGRTQAFVEILEDARRALARASPKP